MFTLDQLEKFVKAPIKTKTTEMHKYISFSIDVELKKKGFSFLYHSYSVEVSKNSAYPYYSIEFNGDIELLEVHYKGEKLANSVNIITEVGKHFESTNIDADLREEFTKAAIEKIKADPVVKSLVGDLPLRSELSQEELTAIHKANSQ